MDRDPALSAKAGGAAGLCIGSSFTTRNLFFLRVAGVKQERGHSSPHSLARSGFSHLLMS